MKGSLRGSYTIEASFVMALVLWALLFSVQSAYRLRDEVVGAMALTESAERLSHNETELPLDEFQVHLSGNPIIGKKVKAAGKGGRWSLELERDVFDPENFLRMLTLVHQEE